MNSVLDIGPLRSFVAIADAGGFHRAASQLSLTQSAVSQHVRRLEAVIGRPLVEPSGRGSRFTSAGEALLVEARQILDLHDQALRRLAGVPTRAFVIGATEHAADYILPPLMARIADDFPDLDLQFKFDRTTRLNEAVESGAIDVAVFVSEASHHTGTSVGTLPLRWCSSPDWMLPAEGQPLPLVAIEAPCTIRSTALRVLAERDIPARVVGDAAYLAGVINAARAGLGIALVALTGTPPEGLIERFDLPPAPPIGLSARVRAGADAAAAAAVLEILSATLSGTGHHPAHPATSTLNVELTAAGLVHS